MLYFLQSICFSFFSGFRTQTNALVVQLVVEGNRQRVPYFGIAMPQYFHFFYSAAAKSN